MNKVDLVERSRLRTDIPPFRPGDQVKVFVRVREGDKVRDQVFEGVVIARRGGGLRESFTVRKMSFGVGVERTFPIHAPAISKLEVVRHGRVRRAKLYYLRELSGKRAKIDERRNRIQTIEDVQAEAEAAEVAAAEVAATEAAITEVVAEAAEATETVTEVDAPATDGADAPAEAPDETPAPAAEDADAKPEGS